MAYTPEFIVQSASSAADATGVKLVVPLVENASIQAFGLYNNGGADVGTGAILKLQGVDTTAAGATFTDLLVATTTAASVRGTNTFRRCDALIEKDPTVLNTAVLTNRAFVNGSQILPSVGKQFIAFQLNLTGAGAMSSTAVFWIKYKKAGSGSTAISGGEVIVTA